MKFEIEFPKQTWLMLRKPCRLQTDGRTDKVNPVYPLPSNFVGLGYNKHCFLVLLFILIVIWCAIKTCLVWKTENHNTGCLFHFTNGLGWYRILTGGYHDLAKSITYLLYQFDYASIVIKQWGTLCRHCSKNNRELAFKTRISCASHFVHVTRTDDRLSGGHVKA